MPERQSINYLVICIAVGVALGTSLGTVFGSVYDNVGLGLTFGPGIGISLGAALGVILQANQSKPGLGTCPHCDYSSKGLPTDTCPECGNSLSTPPPSDPFDL